MFLFFLLVVKLCCNLLWINDKGKRGSYVALCGWAAKADESVLARNQTKDSWTWNLAVSGSGKGTRTGVDDATQQRAVGAGQQAGVDDVTRQRAVGGWTAEKRTAESWRGRTDRGSQHRTPEQRGEAAWDRVQREWVKMSAFQCLWNFR